MLATKRKRSKGDVNPTPVKKAKGLSLQLTGRLPTKDQLWMMNVGKQSLVKHGGVIFAATMGSGKTGAALMLMLHMPQGLPNLFVCTVSIIPGVVREVHEFFGDTVSVAVVEPGASDKSFPPGTDIVVTNRESLRDPQLAEIKWGHLVLDEAHDMRNSDTQRYDIMKNINAKYRILLTGTPINNRPEEVVSLVEQAGLVTVPEGMGPRKFLTENWDQVLRAIQRCSIRINFNPGCEIKRHVVTVEFTEEEAVAHQEAIAEAMAQVASCHMHVFTCDLNLCASSQAKLRAVRELVQAHFTAERGMLIFATMCSMQQQILSMCLDMGISCGLIDGSMSMRERSDVVDALNSGQVRLVVCSSKACRVGLNMQGAADIINVDLQSCNPFDNQQLECRAWRKGQTKEVRLWQLVISKTVESYIPRIHRWKVEMARKMLQCFPTPKDYERNMRLKVSYQTASRACMLKILQKGKRDRTAGVEVAGSSEVRDLIMKTYAEDGTFIGQLEPEVEESPQSGSRSTPITPRKGRAGLWSNT